MTRLNVLLHEMVPDHQIMTPEEVAKLLADYDITEEHLPKMYHDDPAVKACGAKPGMVIYDNYNTEYVTPNEDELSKVTKIE